jgi:hypothetical protein
VLAPKQFWRKKILSSKISFLLSIWIYKLSASRIPCILRKKWSIFTALLKVFKSNNLTTFLYKPCYVDKRNNFTTNNFIKCYFYVKLLITSFFLHHFHIKKLDIKCLWRLYDLSFYIFKPKI